MLYRATTRPQGSLHQTAPEARQAIIGWWQVLPYYPRWYRLLQAATGCTNSAQLVHQRPAAEEVHGGAWLLIGVGTPSYNHSIFTEGTLSLRARY